MLTPNPGLIFWTIATFIILLLLLRKFAWGPLLESLHKREEHIKTSIERAEQAKQESERILEENRKLLARAEGEAQHILNEGRSLSEKLKNDLLEQANQQSRRMVEHAKQEIERDKEAALIQLRGEVASLAIMAAEKILDETLDQAKHGKIINKFLNDLPKN